MTFIDIFFSFKGRVGRLTYLGSGLALTAIEIVGILILDGIDKSLRSSSNGTVNDLVLIIFFIFLGIIVWSLFAISVKRWHDRDKSGWWMLIGLVPIIGPWWAAIELLLFSGTEEQNRFGEKAY